jgi:F420H(2)-dependent biliverdin reductase
LSVPVVAMSLPLPAEAEAFLAEPQLCTLATQRPDGTTHVVPVRFSWDSEARLVRIMTVGTRRKARNLAAAGSRAVACQAVGFRWITLEGPATVSDDPARIAAGALNYARRYGMPAPRPAGLVVIEIAVDRVMGIL